MCFILMIILTEPGAIDQRNCSAGWEKESGWSIQTHPQQEPLSPPSVIFQVSFLGVEDSILFFDRPC